MKTPRSIRAVIADDHSIVREGLAAVINREPDMEVVGEARNWPEAIDQVLQNRPDVAVLDLHMRGMEPADGVATLREKFPAAQIIIYSAFSTDEEVYQVFSAGARGYIVKGDSGREDLLVCIRAVLRGETWVHPSAAARLAARMTAPNLTQREREVLGLMVVGKSNKEIGSSLDVTEGTVKVHVNHILAKLGVTGRVEAIMAAARRGFVHLVGIPQDPARSLASQAAQPTGFHSSTEDVSKAIAPVKSKSQLRSKK
ncbi:MAG: response regulator transcription factor [Candidatus Acidiferrales bacterium]